MAKKKTVIDYSPLSEEQFVKLKGDLDSIKDVLPSNLMNEFWQLCNLIRGDKQPQPCGCKSAGGLWGKCVEDLRTFVNGKQ
jgi:hypothetical protein